MRKYSLNDVRTVENLGLPKGSLDAKEVQIKHSHLRGLPLPTFKNACPKLLIGLNNANLISYHRIVEKAGVDIIAARTKIGWCIFGNSQQNECFSGMTFHIRSQSEEDIELHELVRNYFTTENFGCRPMQTSQKSLEDQRVQEITDGTLRKTKNRYEVGLLWKKDETNLPDSYQMAYKRLLLIENRMKKDPDLFSWYINQIKDYERKGYCKKLSEH
jgi:hypothetical protein